MSLGIAVIAQVLIAVCGWASGMAHTAELRPAAPEWVVVPSQPGDNLPPVGRSLFDEVFAVSRNGQSRIELPFPFAALLDRLDAQVVGDPSSPLPPVKRVLIPLGRSLQRTAAAPDYFAFPRVVVAVDGNMAVNSPWLLKDRLYIGYQEKSAVLEVISYNEQAGRFEFQLVKDYRAGGTPQVYYANRTLCFACHQNGAPIFSRALWDETNANPHNARLLAATGRRFYGIAPERGIDIPYAIDNATERANGFALTQRLWRDGCGGNEQPARRCRAGLYVAALRHALAGGQRWQTDTAFRQLVGDRLLAESRRRWPGGLLVGNPDLPNRNPIPPDGEWPEGTAQRIALSHVAAAFDPLLPRPPRDIWRADAADALPSLIAGLAEFVSDNDRQQLESALSRQKNTPLLRHSAPCRLTRSASRWSMRCPPTGEQPGPSLSATFRLKAGRPVDGRIAYLRLPGGTALAGIDVAQAKPVSPAEIAFSLRLADTRVRTAEGDLLSSLRLSFDDRVPENGQVTFAVRAEFASVEQAVAAILDRPQAESLFAAGVFPRVALLAALLEQLGVSQAMPRPANPQPQPRLETPAIAPGSTGVATVSSANQPFFAYCASCHQSAETFPPNFLSGTPEQIDRRLRQCAPRLYVRLAMTDVPAARRDKTPMPPESLLPAFATDAAGWQESPARKALLTQVGNWLRAENGRPPNLDELLASGYEALRPCLPAP